MYDPNIRRFRVAGARAFAPLYLAASLVASPAFAIQVGRADSTMSMQPSAAPRPVPEQQIRIRYAGFYRYVGDAAEQRARLEAIDQSVASVFFAVRGVARSKVADRTKIMPTCRFEFKDGTIRSTVPGYPVAISPETGASAPYRVEDDAIVLSQRVENGHLVQIFKADEGGTRENEFTLSADGRFLLLRATLSSPKLPVPVVYRLTYQRVE